MILVLHEMVNLCEKCDKYVWGGEGRGIGSGGVESWVYVCMYVCMCFSVDGCSGLDSCIKQGYHFIFALLTTLPGTKRNIFIRGRF